MNKNSRRPEHGVSAALLFARQISDRYGISTVRVLPTERALFVPRLRWIQKFNLTVQAISRSRVTAASRQFPKGAKSAAPQLAIVHIPGPERSEQFETRQTFRESLVERRVTRLREIESIVRAKQRVESAGESIERVTIPHENRRESVLRSMSTVPKVFRKSLRLDREISRPAVASEAEMSRTMRAELPSAAQKGATGAPPAGIDLQLLTEKVIRAIDRRVLAQRERFGES